MNEENETPKSSEPETPVETPPVETPEEEAPKSLIEPPKEEEPAPEFVPLTAEDIKFPENFEVQEEFRDEFLKLANDQELSHKDRTQALTDLYVKAAQQASEASSKLWEDQQVAMQAEVKADPEVGGDKLQPTLAGINKLVSEYGSPELLETFLTTGAGNSIHVIKFLDKVAKVVNEGGPISGGQPRNQESDAASRLFPSMKG